MLKSGSSKVCALWLACSHSSLCSFVLSSLQRYRESGPVVMKCENDISEVAHQQFVDALKDSSEVVSLLHNHCMSTFPTCTGHVATPDRITGCNDALCTCCVTALSVASS